MTDISLNFARNQADDTYQVPLGGKYSQALHAFKIMRNQIKLRQETIKYRCPILFNEKNEVGHDRPIAP